jgi:hypothetical protein
MLPAWATILVAVAGSAVGGVVGALLQTKHERSEGIRERMLVAASEFIARAGRAMALVGDLARAAKDLDGATVASAPDAAKIEAARDALRAMDDALPQIDLLFGVGSKARMHAVAISMGLEDVLGHFDRWPPDPEYLDSWMQADFGYVRFPEYARLAIENYGAVFSRFGRRRLMQAR